MRKALAFYTVMCNREGYPVKYIDPDTYRVKTFRGPFSDPGEASQEFQANIAQAGATSCYLDEQHFQGKARAMAQLRRKDEKQRKAWR